MKIIVFTGPTLPAEEAGRVLKATYLPPVAQGDVYRAALQRPWAIGIVDGLFERVPAVWHKEILWALSQGIHVFGSASMGALRAAELATFGMEGVGAIFEAFYRGELHDDDEVAVTHGSEEDGYRVLSEAMVNIRATLRRAESEGVLAASTGRELERLAKGLFYAERIWPEILSTAERHGLPRAELAALRAWVPRRAVNQKRLDALAMLRVMRERRAEKPGPRRVLFTFEHTDSWETLLRDAARLPVEEGRGEVVPLEALLEELRLEGRYEDELRAALARALALEEARRQGLRHGGNALRRTEEALRDELGSTKPSRFRAWLRESAVKDLEGLLRDEADVRWVREMFAPELERCLPDHLRVTGRYGALVSRASDKQRALREQGLEDPALEEVGLTRDQLWRWYFPERCGRNVPKDLEIAARSAGFEDAEELERAVLREWLYQRARDGGVPE